MQAARHPSFDSGAGVRVLTFIQRALVVAGIVSLAWSAAVIAERQLAQYFAHETLVTMPTVEAPVSTKGSPGLPARREPPAAGTALAEVAIPRVRLSAVVLQGSDARTLRLGVGHIPNTALPGDAGNVAIAGHRDSFFRGLRDVRVGDEVVLDTPRGRVRYLVAWLRVVAPTEVSVLEPTEEAALTLVTCYPFWVFGHAPDRFVVRATRVTDTPLPEIGAAPVAEPPLTRADSAPPSSRAGLSASKHEDDETLVRQAIERFRLTYNARFTTRFEQGGRLMFRGCQVLVDGDQATAACQTAAPPSDSLVVMERTFVLRRAGGVWTIRSFAMAP